MNITEIPGLKTFSDAEKYRCSTGGLFIDPVNSQATDPEIQKLKFFD